MGDLLIIAFKPYQFPELALVRPSFARGVLLMRQFALLGELFALLAVFFGFFIQRDRNGGRAACTGQLNDGNGVDVFATLDAQFIADIEGAARLGAGSKQHDCRWL